MHLLSQTSCGFAGVFLAPRARLPAAFPVRSLRAAGGSENLKDPVRHALRYGEADPDKHPCVSHLYFSDRSRKIGTVRQ